MRRLVALSLVVALAGGILAPVARVEPAHAAEVFTVNHPGDEGDFGDGFCDAYPAEGPQCTLRAALFRANATAARDTIRFALPGPVDQVKSIKPETPLPTIVQPVTIDGYTQPGSSRNTLAAGSNAQLRVQLDGTNAAAPFSFANGLRIDARGVLVRGLVINRFSDSGIWIEGAAAAGVRVVGNFLGTDAGGTRDLGNFHGVRVNNGAAATIGGTTPAVRNLISGNNDGGVTLTDGGANTVIQGNLIGTDRTGTLALGNFVGVIIARTSNATVGGDDAGSRNTIAFNANDGVVLPGAPPEMGNRFLQNAIFDNGDLGIDLNNDGRTRNDPLDADGGPNQLQNWPELTAATRSGGVTTVTGRLRSAPNEAFVLRFFSSPTGGEGKVFRGQLTVATNTNGVSPVFSFRSPTAIPVGHTVTATATDDSRNTSEFSGPWVVSAA